MDKVGDTECVVVVGCTNVVTDVIACALCVNSDVVTGIVMIKGL